MVKEKAYRKAAGRKEYGNLHPDQAKRLKELEKENARLKKLLAETMLDNQVLKDLNSEKY